MKIIFQQEWHSGLESPVYRRPCKEHFNKAKNFKLSNVSLGIYFRFEKRGMAHSVFVFTLPHEQDHNQNTGQSVHYYYGKWDGKKLYSFLQSSRLFSTASGV